MPRRGAMTEEVLGGRATVLRGFDTAPVTLENSLIVTAMFELDPTSVESLLPPALNPSLPPAMTFMAYECPSSPWGAFRMLQLRLNCRAAHRLRSFVVSAVVDNDVAREALSQRWGYPCRPGRIGIRRNFDEVALSVEEAGTSTLDVRLLSPVPVGPADVIFDPNLHAVRSPVGLRLLQVEPVLVPAKADRGKPKVVTFDAPAWGDGGVAPIFPVAGSVVEAEITLAPLAYALFWDQSPLKGVDRVGAAATSA